MIEIKRTITKQVVEDTIVTALEGGSNYWYFLNNVAIKAIKNNTPDMKGEPLSIRFTAALEKGVEIDIHDMENPDDKLGTISLKTMTERTEKLIGDGYGDRLDNIINEIGDAWDADVVFQYWVLNDIVFG